MKQAWRLWLRIAVVIGNANLWVVTTVLFFTIIALMAVPYRVLGDPLRLRRGRTYAWIERANRSNDLAQMRKQS